MSDRSPAGSEQLSGVSSLGGAQPSDSHAEAEASRQVFWLMSVRAVVVTTVLLSALLVQSVTGADFIELNPIYYLVGFTYLLTLVYAQVHARKLWTGHFLHAQFAGDLLIITGLIYYSGGIGSSFTFLYIMTIITASIMLTRRGGLWVALVACVLYGTLVALIYNGVLPQPTGFLATQLPPINQVYFNLFVRWIGLVAAALLSSYVAEKLRETGATLEERSADLEQLQVFYEDVINSVNSGLMTTTLDGRVGSLNRAGESILEQPLPRVVGLTLEEVLDLDVTAEVLLSRVGADGYRFSHPFGTRPTKHLDVVVSRLYDREHLHRGYTIVITDMTTLKKLESEVRIKDRMAAVGEMAAGIAHEIRNPLTSVSGSVQMLRSDLDADGDQRALMDIVVKESDRLNRILEDFLLFAKPSPPIPRDVDLQNLVDETVALFRNSKEVSAGHRIEWSTEEGSIIAPADPDQLRQVLWNLFRNGVQAMPDGGRLWVSIAREDRGVVIAVEDEGAGFGNDDPSQFWEPFQTSRKRGTGLGLAIVYRIIREHGGRVSLARREPRGARVSAWLPVVAPAPAPGTETAGSGHGVESS